MGLTLHLKHVASLPSAEYNGGIFYSVWGRLPGAIERGHVAIDSKVVLFPGIQVDHVGIYGISMAGKLLQRQDPQLDTET